MPYVVEQFRPRISVIAWHNTTKYDLTPYIMQVRTHKSLDDVEGQWTMLLTFQKRWDQILSKMDYIEIKMSRFNPEPVMIMRGFISNIRRTRTMDATGSWRRTLTINGSDYGKLLKNYQLYYMANIPGQQLSGTDVDPSQGLLSPLLSENLGVFKDAVNGIISLSEFMPAMIDKTINPWIKSLQKNTPAIPQLHTNVNVLSDYKLNWLTLQSMQGSLNDVISQFENAPWCEYLLIDAVDAPKLIHRNTPFKDGKGKFIFKESALDPRYWGTTVIHDKQIMEEDIGSTDAETYDYFFTYPSLFTAGDLEYKFAVIGAGEFGNGSDADKYKKETDLSYPTNPKVISDFIYRYGLKIMEVAAPAIPVVDTNNPDNLSMKLSIKLNMWLVNAFGWAPDMLNGTIRMQGNEYVNIGKYLFSKDMQEEYYVESVDHVFTITQAGSRGDDKVYSFESTAAVTRGRSAKAPDYGVEPDPQSTVFTNQGGNYGNPRIKPN